MARTKDPLARLELRQSVAVRQFADAADELEQVAEELHRHANQADDAANVAALRAANARTQAHDATRRAGKIRELLG
jgi:methyl-accepting chemotaxis protein